MNGCQRHRAALGDAAEHVDETGHAGVGGADHRQARFHATENRVGQMLLRTGGFHEPAVVRHVGEQVRPARTNCRVSSPIVSSKQISGASCTSSRVILKTVCSVPKPKSSGTWSPTMRAMPGQRVSAGNVFAERNEVHFAIELHLLAAVGDEERGVVGGFLVLDRSRREADRPWRRPRNP